MVMTNAIDMWIILFQKNNHETTKSEKHENLKVFFVFCQFHSFVMIDCFLFVCSQAG